MFTKSFCTKDINWPNFQEVYFKLKLNLDEIGFSILHDQFL